MLIRMRAGLTYDGRRPDDEQPAQVTVALLGDRTQPLLAAAGVLPRHQADPSGELAARFEHLGISHRGGNRGRTDDTDARDCLQPLAHFVYTMLSLKVTLNISDLATQGVELTEHGLQSAPGQIGKLTHLVSYQG